MATSPDAPLPQSPLAAGTDAADNGPKTLRERIAEGLARLSSGQKIALMVALAAVVAIIVGSLLYSSQPTYKVLFSNLSEKDGGAIISSLEQMNVPYKFSEGGGAILVQSNKVHEARLRLATQGLPKGGSVGFELMENQKFGISQFLEQVNYQRALEGELARTIQAISAVSMARVHLAIPKPSVFVREEQKPTASVMLQLHPGRPLEPQQIAGITHLVASSIPQLPASNISIVDQNGNLLSQLKSPLGEAGLDPTQLKYIKEVENGVAKRIEEILAPITGDDNVRVQAAADVDFSQQEQTAESYKPNGDPAQASIRSQQSSEQAQANPNPLGVPGALSNQPPVPATALITNPAVPTPPGGTGVNAQGQVNAAGIRAQIGTVGQPLSARKDSTVNYEIDRTITHTKNQLGRIKRLTVAVVVNHKLDKDKAGKVAPRPLSEAELKQLNDLARDAMGFSQQRGDSLSVVNATFSPAKEELSLPFWKHPEFFDFLKELAKYALVAGVVLYIMLSVVRPIVKQMFPPPPEQEPSTATGGVGGTLSTTDEADAEENEEEEELNMAYATYERKLAKAKEIATQDPKAVANILKEWISPNA